MDRSKILVTGCAGFIGFHLSLVLLNQGYHVVGIDNVNDYYDTQLKHDRLELLQKSGLLFERMDLTDTDGLNELFRLHNFHAVVHLAAQAGVRHSINHPHAYIKSNIEGYLNILEACRHHKIGHLIYASSSSVYGANQNPSCSTQDLTDRPVSLYGATKKANELMAHSYAWMYGMPVTGLRFFTVYGPWGRPDMALYVFAKAILEEQTIALFNHGKMERDFTFVDDITEAISRLIERPPARSENGAPAAVFNVGNHSPVALTDFLSLIERFLGKQAKVELKPMQPGDVRATCADVSELEQYVEFRPTTPLEVGIKKSLTWYLDYRQQRGL